jgi:hypothetical protein
MIKQIVTVLLIEDNPEYAALIRRWLSPKEDIELSSTGPIRWRRA